MFSKGTSITIASKLVILFVNFFLVVLSAQIWGSEGRGEIALVIANIAIITIIANITCGSTVAFHAPRMGRDELMGVALIGALVLSVTSSLIFSLILGFEYFWHLFIISALMSLSNSVSLYWLGRENIKWYNLLTLIVPIAILGFLALLYYSYGITSVDAFFYAYYFAYAFVLITGIIGLAGKERFRWPGISLSGVKKIVGYGFSNELNYFIQFLNYRLTYFFIEEWLGLSPLGVFSVSVSIAEAIWVVSKSLSVIHFSKVVNSPNQYANIQRTKVLARQSLWVSLAIIALLIVTPQSLFVFIFGNDFVDVKQFTIYLIPGIIAIAVSNLYGHYFAGIGKLNILRNKSLIGLTATLILSLILIPKYHLLGACITLNVSHILSSGYLWYRFQKQ
ncbi:MAG: polysaccharide biosynthesis C-terminal domain-containing protein [Bacteroidota bacterium]|nr:polysaccharide biosynthesis C-terminal domain-containing protein [Bacteroidota bacterium]